VNKENVMPRDYSYTTQYAVQCEGCDNATGYFHDEESAAEQAEKLGFISVDDVSGQMNWCAKCKEME
jgi:hypothetical protein